MQSEIASWTRSQGARLGGGWRVSRVDDRQWIHRGRSIFPVFLHPDTKEEYALARLERSTGPGYGDFEFDTAEDVSLEDDLKRRDLTINAIAQDSEGHLIDPYGGQADLARRLLRHVSPAFDEDPLRVLRLRGLKHN